MYHVYIAEFYPKLGSDAKKDANEEWEWNRCQTACGLANLFAEVHSSVLSTDSHKIGICEICMISLNSVLTLSKLSFPMILCYNPLNQ